MRILPPPSDEERRQYIDAGFWTTEMLHQVARRVAASEPDRVAVVDEDGSRLSYGALVSAVDRAIAGLHRLGVANGDVVGVLLPNRHEVVVLSLALEALGATNVPLAPNYRSREVGHILRVTHAKAIVLMPEMRGTDFGTMVAELRPTLPDLRTVISVAPLEGATMWTDLLGGGTEGSPPLATDMEAVFEIGFTSGSTGLPKGVMHTANTHGWDYRAVANALALGSEDVVFMAATVGHQLGFALGTRLPIHLGARVVFCERWRPADAIKQMARERTTFTCTTPTFLVDVFASPELASHDLSSMRVWLLAGAVVHDQLIEDAREKLPNLTIAQVFGMTEVGAVLINPPKSGRLNATGLAQPGAEVRVVDDDGRAVEEGELQIRGPAVCCGSLGLPDVTRASFTSDGWFKSGDRVRRDADGFFYVTGRIKDLIKRGGESVSPAEVEEVLLMHPQVREAAVIGLPDHRLGERVCAVIVAAEGPPPTLEVLLAHVSAEGLARQKWPERLEIVEDLPKTSIGKIDKAELRKRYG